MDKSFTIRYIISVHPNSGVNSHQGHVIFSQHFILCFFKINSLKSSVTTHILVCRLKQSLLVCQDDDEPASDHVNTVSLLRFSQDPAVI